MKKTILMFAAAIVLLATPSCKKGENDPFLSLKTRDARITGVWELSSMSSTSTNTNISSGTTTISTSTTNYDGTLLTTTSGGNTWSVSYSQEMTINKDGTYSMKEVDDGDTQESTGYWWWLTDKKKKTRIALDDDWNSFAIDQLKNKEMILKVNTMDKYTDNNGDIDEDVYEYTATYTKK